MLKHNLWWMLGLLLAATGTTNTHAVPVTIQGSRVDSALVDVHLFDGELYLGEGQISEALEQLERAYYLDPERRRTRWLLAETLTRVILEGRSAEAGTMGRDAIKHWLWLSQDPADQRTAIDRMQELASFFAAHTGDLLESKVARRAWDRAGEALAAGDTTQAVASFRRVLDLEPQALGVRGHLGQALLNQKQYAAAEAVFRGAVNDNPYDAPAVSGMARALEQQGHPKEALVAYKNAIHAQFRDLGTARGVLRLMQRKAPSDLSAEDAFVFGQALLITNHVEDAIRYLGWAIQSDANPEYQRSFGTALYFDHKYRRAVAALEKAYDSNPDLETTYYLGACHLEMGEEGRGVMYLREVLERDSENPNALRLLGLTLAKEPGLEEEAVDVLQRAVAAGASIPDLPCLLGMLNSRLDNEVEARRQFNACLQNNEDYAPAHLALGLMADERGDRGQAVVHFEQYLDRAPADAAVLLRLGVAYLRLGRDDDGYAALERLVRLNPALADSNQASPDHQTLLEIASFFLGSAHRYDDAIWVGERLLDMSPENAVYNNNLAMVYADADRNPERAHELAEKANAIDPQNPGHIDTLAWTLVRLGKLDQAENLLLQSIDLAQQAEVGNMSEIYYHLGYVYKAMGKSDDSRTWLEKALENPPTPFLRDAIDSLLSP